ncbi:hypothetical protein [Aquimarina sp. 2201CG5-10]|uniref:hypothetical protein n=1 Tax=Aquimarina callyspongiae TaxID=3098150 RepID=UPI002AB49F70|nr:hypothetical protein [Aquimarina sp. 2201CG5-10]MDY8136291.1 hypothetical protein [Aquimarina sp. 2201CG5-10]
MKKITILKYLVPAVMIFFFVRNVVLVETDGMDSWMGGGMRMFGKVDKMLYRVSGFNVEHNGNVYFVNLRNVPELEDEDVKARILPNDKRLKSILGKIKTYSWCYDSISDSVVLRKDGTCISIDKGAIKSVEVYRIQYDESSKKINLNQINDVQSK